MEEVYEEGMGSGKKEKNEKKAGWGQGKSVCVCKKTRGVIRSERGVG